MWIAEGAVSAQSPELANDVLGPDGGHVGVGVLDDKGRARGAPGADVARLYDDALATQRLLKLLGVAPCENGGAEDDLCEVHCRAARAKQSYW